MKKRFLYITVLISTTFILGGLFSTASAASFQITPISGSFNIGDRFQVTVLVDSQGTAINAAEGTINFDPRYLSVDNISTNVSIFKFWAEQPTYSNAAGTIEFSGGLPTPGFSGSSGQIFSIVFKAVSSGQSSVSFDSGAILANDGLGTNVLETSQRASYSIKTISIAPSVDPIILNLPQTPSIISETHPNEFSWFSAGTFKASWSLPDDINGVNYALFNSKNYSLPKNSKGLVEEAIYNIEDLGEGQWYFFLRFRNSSGWGPVLTRLVRSDWTPPHSLEITRKDIEDPTNPQPVLLIGAKDDVSGIDHFMFKVGDNDWLSASSSPFALTPQKPGNYQVEVRAVDRAGNYNSKNVNINVESIERPYISFYSDDFDPPEKPLIVGGTAVPGTDIVGILTRENETFSFQGKVEQDGKWSLLFAGEVNPGKYTLTIRSRDSRGAYSKATDPITIRKSGQFGVYKTIGIILVLLTIFAVFIKKNKKVSKKVKKLLHSLEKSI